MSTRWTPAASAASTCSAGAEAAADLQARPAPARQPREHRRVLGAALAVARRVEVDHVQPAGPGQREAVGGLVGRLVEARDPPVVALQQAHDAAAGEIDGRDDFHCHDTMLTWHTDELERSWPARVARRLRRRAAARAGTLAQRRGARGVPARPLHARRDPGHGAPPRRRAARRPRRALRRGGRARRRLDHDRHARRALAAPRRGRLPPRARPAGAEARSDAAAACCGSRCPRRAASRSPPRGS